RIDRTALERRARVGRCHVHRLDVAPLQAAALDGLHREEVRARTLLKRDALALQVGQGLQHRVGLDEDRRAVGLGGVRADVEQVLARGLRENRWRVADAAEVDTADRKRLQQLWPRWKLDPRDVRAGQACLEQAETFQLHEIERALLKADAQLAAAVRTRG